MATNISDLSKIPGYTERPGVYIDGEFLPLHQQEGSITIDSLGVPDTESVIWTDGNVTPVETMTKNPGRLIVPFPGEMGVLDYILSKIKEGLKFKIEFRDQISGRVATMEQARFIAPTGFAIGKSAQQITVEGSEVSFS